MAFGRDAARPRANIRAARLWTCANGVAAWSTRAAICRGGSLSAISLRCTASLRAVAGAIRITATRRSGLARPHAGIVSALFSGRTAFLRCRGRPYRQQAHSADDPRGRYLRIGAQSPFVGVHHPMYNWGIGARAPILRTLRRGGADAYASLELFCGRRIGAARIAVLDGRQGSLRGLSVQDIADRRYPEIVQPASAATAAFAGSNDGQFCLRI